jgi:replicative DNA helicase
VSDDGELIAETGAERALLGCALLAPQRAIEILGDTTADDFTDARCRDVHGAIRAIAAGGGTPDPIVVLGHLRASGQATSIARSREPGTWLHDLAESAPVPTSAAAYREILVQHTYRRAVAAAADRWAQVARTGPIDECDRALDELHAAAVLVRRRLRRGRPTLTAITGGGA